MELGSIGRRRLLRECAGRRLFLFPNRRPRWLMKTRRPLDTGSGRLNPPAGTEFETLEGIDSGLLDRRLLLDALQRVQQGDFTVRLPGSLTEIDGKIADTFNQIVWANQKMAEELRRVGQVVGREGRTRERARFDQPRGAWGEMETSVNTLIDD